MTTVFLSDGRHMVSVAEDAILCVWDNQTGRRVLTFDKHSKPTWVFGLAGGNRVMSLVPARSAPIVATADADNVIRVWNGLSGLELAVVEPCSSGPGCRLPWGVSIGRPALSDDGRVLATFQTAEFKDVVRLWDISTGAELGTIAMSERVYLGRANRINLALSPHGRRLAVHWGDHVEIWRFGRKPSPANAAEPSEGSLELEHVIILPPLDKAHRHLNLLGPLAFSADGRRLAVGGGMTIVLETDGWHEIWRAELGNRQFWSFAFMPEGRHIVTACCVWQLPEPTAPVSVIPES